MEKTSVPRNEQLALAAQWLNRRMAGNPAWRPSMPAARTAIVRERRVFIAWCLVDDQPRILDALRIEDVSASFTAGLSLTLVSSTTGAKVPVSSYPREIVPGVFAWIPPFADVRFAPPTGEAGSVWSMSLPMSTRVTDDRPGHTCFSTLKEFHALWPDVSL